MQDEHPTVGRRLGDHHATTTSQGDHHTAGRPSRDHHTAGRPQGSPLLYYEAAWQARPWEGWTFMVALRGLSDDAGSSLNGPHPHHRATIWATLVFASLLLACHYPQIIEGTGGFAIACAGVYVGALVGSIPCHDGGGAPWYNVRSCAVQRCQ
jgi:hypothetical protein